MSGKAKSPSKEEKEEVVSKPSGKKYKCGIVMPISGCSEYKAVHWETVLRIVKETFEDTDYEVELVSKSTSTGVIQHRIVENLYSCDMIICDVSSRNPNVMLELGIRLAFDKPTIIIKDEKTSYPFDITAVEYIRYPSDLSYYDILDFQDELKSKLICTHKDSLDKNSGYKSFLSHFGQFKITPGTIENKEVGSLQEVLDYMRDIKDMIQVREVKSYPPSISQAIAREGRSLKTSLPLKEILWEYLEICNYSPDILENIELDDILNSFLLFMKNNYTESYNMVENTINRSQSYRMGLTSFIRREINRYFEYKKTL